MSRRLLAQVMCLIVVACLALGGTALMVHQVTRPSCQDTHSNPLDCLGR